MKLSTKGQYGLKAMYDLALNYGNEPISLKSIAERQEISEYYLEQLMAILRKAGLVRSVRGAYGGYMLTRDPSEITVGDVLRALEGPIGIVDCVLEQDAIKCLKYENCISRIVWEKIRDSIIKTIDSITLLDMCNEARKKLRAETFRNYS
ncbi:MAG TPA: Rrf2 family transcriptional regulator [Thermoanaerobacterales bacterium]|uniref:RrF2 family transcriptional regulator n=1 Tax=Tepidanaerobacter sp. GT38 TaxID=2722793 RepID=UPI0017E6BB06|nr:Rrf2 family transcriptional regulator [Tepidanaerobacter sp. GT38]MCG1011740.1 Rrf2 family transcriptional regulator [Tepidanaerobacter sp. GT38]HHY42299.1 Rrf2 family transcriptional regulator [Thermoanaerobacterales bacterium]